MQRLITWKSHENTHRANCFMSLRNVTDMFSSRIERFDTSELSGVGKNHGDTFWRHPKDVVIRTQIFLITGKKRHYEELFLPGH